MKRYNLETVLGSWEGALEMRPYETGDWVQYDDVADLQARLDAAIKGLEIAIDYGRCSCVLGFPCGPWHDPTAHEQCKYVATIRAALRKAKGET